MKTIKIEDLLPDEHNPRQRTERGEEVLDTSMKRYGAGRSIVIDRNGKVIAGNGTLKAAKDAGITEVVVVEGASDRLVAVQRADWDEKEAEGYSVVDNKSAELAKWDYPVLLQKLDLPEMKAGDFGFLNTEVASLKANASWMGTGDAKVDGGAGKESTKAFDMVKFQVTVLDETKAAEVQDFLEQVAEHFGEGVIMERL